MRDLEEDEGGAGADEGAEHVALGVPAITLGAEERFGGLYRYEGGGPFDEFVDGAYGHADGDHAEGHPAALCDDIVAHENFAADDGGDEALQEMAEAVIVVAGKVEGIFRPIADRDECVGVAAADHEDDHVQADEDEGEIREPPAFRLGDEDGDEADENRGDLKPPGRPVVGMPAGPDEHGQHRHLKQVIGMGFHSFD